MDDGYVDDGGAAGPSRRDFIRRGAIALGVTAWGVPLVQVVRARGHAHGTDPAPPPQEIGVQDITASCTTCILTCASVTVCGSNGIFDCLCAPSADVYPLADCLCASDVFCDDPTTILCSDGCPPGWGCAQGCCDAPVCLPPCPATPLAQSQAQTPAFAAESQSQGRLTVSGRRI